MDHQRLRAMIISEEVNACRGSSPHPLWVRARQVGAAQGGRRAGLAGWPVVLAVPQGLALGASPLADPAARQPGPDPRPPRRRVVPPIPLHERPRDQLLRSGREWRLHPHWVTSDPWHLVTVQTGALPVVATVRIHREGRVAVTAVPVNVESSCRPPRARRSASILVAAVALACALGSCGTPTQTGPPAAPTSAAASPTSAPPAACADVADLKASLVALTEVKPTEDGVAALKTAIANVESNLASTKASTSEMLKPSVEQVKTAFAQLQTAAGGLTADNLRQKAPSILAAMTGVRTATANLSSTLTQSCPG